MTPCWTRDLCIWHTEWLHVGLVICVSAIIQNDGMLDLWSVYLTLYRMMMDSWSVYLPLYRMTTCWTRDLCICHYTEWQHVGLVIYVSGIIQNDVGLVICASDIIQNDAMLDSWSVYLTYRMTPCRTRDLCIWHNTEWWWTRDLCICHYTEWQHVGLVICVSAIIQNDNMLDSWSMYLALYGMMLDLWSVYLTWYRMMMDSWSVYLTFYRMTPCWTRDLCIWHFTEWRHVGLVICVSDILQNDAMLDSWSVYLTLYRMASCWTSDLYLTLYRMTPCWTRDMWIWHYTWWCNVGLMICVSDIIQNDGMLDLWSMYLALYRMMLDSWSVHLTLYRMTPCWTRDLCIWHNTEWRYVGLVICVSDIIQNDNMLDSWSVHLTLYRMTPCWTRDLCIWRTEWLHVGLVICASDIIQNDAMLDSWSVYLTYRMTPCRTRDLCIWHNTEWRHVGLVICVSDIIQNDDGLVICVSAIIQNDNMLDSWSVYLPLYRMTTCWTRDLCIWHYTEWCWTRDLCIWHYTEWRHVGLVICVSDIQNDSM